MTQEVEIPLFSYYNPSDPSFYFDCKNQLWKFEVDSDIIVKMANNGTSEHIIELDSREMFAGGEFTVKILVYLEDYPTILGEYEMKVSVYEIKIEQL